LIEFGFSLTSPDRRQGRGIRQNSPCSRYFERLDQLADLGAGSRRWKEAGRRYDAVIAKLPEIEKWAFCLGRREADDCVKDTRQKETGQKETGQQFTLLLNTKTKKTENTTTNAMLSKKRKNNGGSRTRTPRPANLKVTPAKTPASGKKGPGSAPKDKGTDEDRKAARAVSKKASKKEKILRLLRRTGGATLKELMRATGWQAHSVRGFLSAQVGKKMGLKVVSAKAGDKERRYSVIA
jgi:hypothetical protein